MGAGVLGGDRVCNRGEEGCNGPMNQGCRSRAQLSCICVIPGGTGKGVQ